MGLEVDMEPLGPAFARDFLCHLDQSRGNSLSPHSRRNAGIQDEGMNAAIPGDIDEAYEFITDKSADVTQTARQNSRKIPVRVCAPGCSPQPVQRIIGRKRINAQCYIRLVQFRVPLEPLPGSGSA